MPQTNNGQSSVATDEMHLLDDREDSENGDAEKTSPRSPIAISSAEEHKTATGNKRMELFEDEKMYLELSRPGSPNDWSSSANAPLLSEGMQAVEEEMTPKIPEEKKKLFSNSEYKKAFTDFLVRYDTSLASRN